LNNFTIENQDSTIIDVLAVLPSFRKLCRHLFQGMEDFL